MARSAKLLLLSLLFGVLLLETVKCYQPHHPHTQTLSLCDASRESTEECEEGINKNPKFLLYKYVNSEGKHVPISLDVEQIVDAQPENGAVWKILIHGFLNNATSPFPVNVRDAYIERYKKTGIIYNILVVDWSELSCASLAHAKDYLYDYAAKNTAHVGKKLGDLIVFLHSNKFLDLTNDVHLIGFSLGAHVAGQAGRRVFNMLGKTIRRITALDPAGPAFWKSILIPDFIMPLRRIQKQDTQFADIYHTSSFFGTKYPMGDVDFWINDGSSQPSCVPKTLSFFRFKDYTQVCSHNYVTRLYAKSILDNSMHGCLCPSHTSYKWGSCKCTEKAVLGEMLDNSTLTVGEFYYDPPRDDDVLKEMGSWKNFSIKNMIKELGEMICT